MGIHIYRFRIVLTNMQNSRCSEIVGRRKIRSVFLEKRQREKKGRNLDANCNHIDASISPRQALETDRRCFRPITFFSSLRPPPDRVFSSRIPFVPLSVETYLR